MMHRLLLAIASLTIAAQVSATPAMSVLTINSEDPIKYLEWAKRSGPAIGKAVNAVEGGVCVSEAGFYAPGELYYWHIFQSHASVIGISPYSEGVRKEVQKLKVDRTVTRSDSLSLVMAEELINEVGEVFCQPPATTLKTAQLMEASPEKCWGICVALPRLGARRPRLSGPSPHEGPRGARLGASVVPSVQ